MIHFLLLDIVKHLNTGVFDGIFPVAGWDYTSYVTGDTSVREVLAVHDDIGIVKCLDDGVGSQCTF